MSTVWEKISNLRLMGRKRTGITKPSLSRRKSARRKKNKQATASRKTNRRGKK